MLGWKFLTLPQPTHKPLLSKSEGAATRADVVREEKSGAQAATRADVVREEKSGAQAATRADVVREEKSGAQAATRTDVVREEKSRGAIYIAQLVVLVVILKPFSNLLLAYGERHFSHAPMVNPLWYIASLFDPFVAAGVAIQIWWLFSRMRLFSLADLSFVIPVTAVGYVLTSLLGKIFLHEIISPFRWAGIGLVCVGSILVAGTARNTTRGVGA